MTRILSVLLALLPLVATAGVERITVDFDYVCQRARAAVAAPYAAPPPLPRRLAEMPPAAVAAIEPRADRALWAAERLPFLVQFYHPGPPWSEPVRLHEFSPRYVQEIPFAADFFDYGAGPAPGRLPPDLGYAGFRLHAPINRPEVMDEVVSFLGASYFRALAAGQVYGLSARGLALDCGLEAPEEFPRFTDCWIGKPAAGAASVTLYALLDSPRACGAMEFVVRPGGTTTIDVRAEFHFRAMVARPGFAPLTSMFWFGESTGRPDGQPRPEVHDSDGLAIETSDGGRLWRPLQNPGASFSSGIPAVNPRGFGLLQRDRVFEHYEDLDARYERRPSAWVEPVGEWGAGTVQLVELPTRDERTNNIVAFWVPAEKPGPGSPLRLAYRMHWRTDEPPAEPLARAMATFIGSDPAAPLRRVFWIDFAGEETAKRAPGELAAEVHVDESVRIVRQRTLKNPNNASWRVELEVEAAQPRRAVVLNCRLRAGYTPMSETWNFSWMP